MSEQGGGVLGPPCKAKYRLFDRLLSLKEKQKFRFVLFFFEKIWRPISFFGLRPLLLV